MADVWEDLIRDSLVEIGVRDPGEALDDDEKADGLRRLKGMLDEWGLEGLLVPGLQTVNHTFTKTASVITIGPDQVDDDDDPDIMTTLLIEEVDALNYRRSGQQQSRPLDPTSYAVISETRSDFRYWPRQYYYDVAHPIIRIHFDANVESGDRMELTGRGHFDSAMITLAANTGVLLPKGYREPVLLNLAVKLAASYGVRDTGGRAGISDETKRAARRGKSLIKTRNLQVVEARIDPALVNHSSSQLLRRNAMTSR